MQTRVAVVAVGLLVSLVARAQDVLSFEAISARHASVRLTGAELDVARGEGECLAGIKVLGSLPPEEFQPNIEWLNIRTQALLALARPCEVLVMLEAAHDALGTSNAPGQTE